jgi:uncharacterized phage protein (TIGR02218 family)
VAFASHTRDLVFGGTTYKAAPAPVSQISQTLGVQQANHGELLGVFDDVLSEEELQGGKWKNAAIVYELIVYDPATGAASGTVTDSVGKQRGQVGQVTINNGTFTVEFRSLSARLHQEIGSLTSPIDRRRKIEDLGISTAPYIFARTVTSFVDRRNFTVGGTAQVDDYFKYGRAQWTSGNNNGLSMEIKSSVGNVIELQLPMRSNIQNGDTVDLYAGYDGSVDQARDKFVGSMDGFDAEPHLPGIRSVISYPE